MISNNKTPIFACQMLYAVKNIKDKINKNYLSVLVSAACRSLGKIPSGEI